MGLTRENAEILKKASKSKASGDIAKRNQSIILPQRVFLYLQPKSITYPLENIPTNKSEIELEHQCNIITTLSDYYMGRNIIPINQFDTLKPTFCVTIEQDSLENITMLSDCPILLTLYVYKNGRSTSSETLGKSFTDEARSDDIRMPVAQGHIDIIGYFHNKRASGTETVFLYPLRNYDHTFTCKTEWEIYSLHPLLKTVEFSNFLFITLDSLYNVTQELLNDCEHLEANLSFISKIPNEKNDFDKIFICNFKKFSKSIIDQQNLKKTWETLKNHELGNINCLGIASEFKICLNQLFSNLLSTDNVVLNFDGIDIAEDLAMICNSMHRYVLTDSMQKTLEDILSRNLYHIVLEIYSEWDKINILLQGYVDLSIFMYPKVNNCFFAIELRTPVNKFTNQTSGKEFSKYKNSKTKNKNSQDQPLKEDNHITFAIMQICLYTSITDPCQRTTKISNQNPKHNKVCEYAATLAKTARISLLSNCEKNYRSFDDLILEIIDYMINNNIRALKDDREFFCHQYSNINNKIIKLVACDFNIKSPTKTNIEFTKLTTTVYRDLISRIHKNLSKCSINGLKDCAFSTTNTQQFIVKNMSLAKYLYEVGNIKMANVIMNILHSEYLNNTIIAFYVFLYDIERQNFELAIKYLNEPLVHKDMLAELFADLIQIYINYKLQSQDSELKLLAEENLIKALSDYSEGHNPLSSTSFIILYCIYKRHNYQSGMAYCRLHYENLYDSKFFQLDFIPKSRWEIYMPHKIHLKSFKGENFIKVCCNLLRLGLYNFAQWVFDEIADECTEIERYFFSTTFMILENNLQKNLSIKSHSMDKIASNLQLHAILSLANGNLEYFRAIDNPACFKHYRDIAELKDLEDHSLYQLGLLRYAYKAMEEAKYEEAGHIFLSLCNDETSCLAAAVGRGKSCYYLGLLDESEKYFALSTEYNIYMENTWAFLALINLKKSNIFKALECWKYARLNHNTDVDEEIISELKKINYSDVLLFVDVPNKI